MICGVFSELTTFYCSIEFDRDDELFATAGVSRCIKVFDFSMVRSWFQELFAFCFESGCFAS